MVFATNIYLNLSH